MAKFSQKTYKGYKFTAKIPNFEKMTFEEKTVIINKPNFSDARKQALIELGFKGVDSIPLEHEVIQKTMIVPTVLLDELFEKYGREKTESDTDVE